jgi:hypothetical protein
MTEKPATAMLSLDPQPVYLIAGQTAAEQPGLSLMDVLVWAYRRRWWLMIWFVALIGVQVFQLLGAGQAQFVFTVRSERGTIDPVAVALQDELARYGDTVRSLNPQIDYMKMGTGSKAEQSRNALVVQVTAAADVESPALIDALRRAAEAAVSKAEANDLQQANMTLQVATSRIEALRSDPTATSIERSGAELSAANAKVAVEMPLKLQISEIQRNPVKGSLVRALALAAVISGFGSLLLVGLVSGYGEIRRRAAQS